MEADVFLHGRTRDQMYEGLKGMNGNAKVRTGIYQCNTRAELVEILTNYVEEMEANEEVKVG
ncbi:hypothetical protein AN964_20735 [Heyndrickxia shackletonii]|uniref:Uncharacterized protein n=1 Tax=Heyndrickxia shackletonii TaxID=157838 RepID=A0A0Q3TCS5_9BACI|nr:hypothetical protein [Heyndrickxia shackletonii]KQL51401.1 hypothetical protein AN964_20735 [Heyndrickxia shackletonii]MBB2481413.1 hypothetical protein [Bacillus sp. APMAM]